MLESAGKQVEHAEAMLMLQEVLDIQSRALMENDADAMRATVNLPYRRLTMDADVIIERDEDMQKGMNVFGYSLRSLGVNHLIRLATDGQFLNKNLIEGHFVTHALSNATQMVPSYLNRVVLQNFDGVWKMIELASEIASQGWPVNLLHVAGAGSVRNSRDDYDPRRDVSHPLPVYQDFLDRFTDASLTQDFDAYVALLDLPFTFHGNEVDTLLSSPEDVRPFYELNVEMINGETADSIERKADTAQFLGPDMICGYHIGQLYKNGLQALPAVKSRMILKHTGMGWKLKHVTNAIANPTYPHIAPVPANALPTHREIQERTKSWPTSL